MLSEWNRDWAKLALGILRQSNLSIALQAMARLTLALLTSLTFERGLKCKASGRNIAYKENPNDLSVLPQARDSTENVVTISRH